MVNTVKLLLILLPSRPASSGTEGVLPCGWLPHLKLRPPQAWCCALGCGTFPQGGSPARHLGITCSSVGGRWGNGGTSLGVAAESCRPPESQLGTWQSPCPARCVPCHSLSPTPESQVGWMEGSVAGGGLWPQDGGTRRTAARLDKAFYVQSPVMTNENHWAQLLLCPDSPPSCCSHSSSPKSLVLSMGCP